MRRRARVVRESPLSRNMIIHLYSMQEFEEALKWIDVALERA
jgi:hypothetical protein